MAVRGTFIIGVLVGLTLAGAFLVGCNQKQADAPKAGDAPPEALAAQPEGQAGAPKQQVPVDPRLQQSFAEATRSDPPAECQRPPDLTLTNKPTGKLLAEVQRLWDTIPFVTDEGKPLTYTATLETKLGSIEIALRPEWAPNHVRNFIALARAGYYDGLLFERVVHQKSDVQPEATLDLVEAGCPLGTGEAGYGSIGYWLKPEFDAKLHHEEGVVGACHGEEADTAACRFYVALGKAPVLDGNYTVFGKVTRGLDVVHTIAKQPVIQSDEDAEGYHRPEKPVVIEKVSIRVGQ